MNLHLQSPKQAAAALGVHAETVRRWIRAGAPAYRISARCVRVDLDELMRWLIQRAQRRTSQL